MKAGNQAVSSGIIQPATVPETSFDKILAQFIEMQRKCNESNA
jgi:hypothetical protein